MTKKEHVLHPDACEKTPAEFKIDLEKMIEGLKSRKEHMSQLQSTIPQLMTRHEFELSVIDAAAIWYGEKIYWYHKTLLLLLISSSLYLIRLVIAFAPLFVIMATLLYLVVTVLLTHHYNVIQRREERLSGMIKNMEDNVTQMVAILDNAHHQGCDILITLCQINNLSADKLDVFNTQMVTLNDQTTLFADTVEQLKGTNEILMTNNQKTTAELERLCKELNETHLELQKQPTHFESITAQLDNTNRSLFSSHLDFSTLCEKLRTDLLSISELACSMKNLFDCTDDSTTAAKDNEEACLKIKTARDFLSHIKAQNQDRQNSPLVKQSLFASDDLAVSGLEERPTHLNENHCRGVTFLVRQDQGCPIII